MGEILNPHICVIGAGVAGTTAALAAAAYGIPIVLVEKSKIGGTHLYSGCIPSKALIAAARRAEAIRQAKPLGLNVPRPKIDFYQVHDHIHGVVAAAAANHSAERLGALGVQVIRGTARFKDKTTVAVGQDIAIHAKRFIIATGSSPAIPEIPGIAETPYLTNETIFDLLVCPRHLAIIGATSAGLEFAQAYARLGAEVTVLDAGQPLADEDPECAAVVLDQLEREGISVRAGVHISRIKAVRSKIQIEIAGEGENRIEASHVLLAAGRAPNIAELALDAAGVHCEPDGIVVDRHLKTSNKKIYAIGDVTRGSRSTHGAKHHAQIAVDNALFRLPCQVKSDELPRVTYTEPELAHVGLTEAAFRKSRRDLRVLRWPYRENDRARAELQTRGHIKIIAGKRGRILGVTIVGAQASELITAWTLAISRKMTVRDLSALSVPFPTRSEIGGQAATSYSMPRLAPLWIRRILAVLRPLG